MDVTATGDFPRFFSDLPDPRGVNKIHKLCDMIMMAVICGADGWEQVAFFGRTKHKWLSSFMQLPGGIPSHDTFGRVFGLLDPEAFERCFVAWMPALAQCRGGRLIAIDGKSIRRSFEHAWDKSGMVYLVSAMLNQEANRLVFAQLAVEEKSNEISAIPKLLALMNLQGVVVTIDAIGTQREIARTIIDAKGDYILSVKENQPHLLAKVKALLDDAVLGPVDGSQVATFQQRDQSHGRIETRQIWVVNDTHCPGRRTA